MAWQDLAIVAIQIMFTVTLVPTAMRPDAHVPLATSLPTTLGLYGLAVIFASLDLYWGAASSMATGTIWLWILIKRRPVPRTTSLEVAA